MAVEQRDVYLIPPPFDNELANHPFIVLSVKEANEYEGTFVCAMITSMEYKDEYSFMLVDSMFEHPLRKNDCHVRMHLLTLCLGKEIVGQRINKMKPLYFKELMKSIGDFIFNYDFVPRQ